jgi:hypothetical protein
MKCDNCGKEQPTVIMQVRLNRGDGVTHPADWCLECVQGKNAVRTSYERPTA